MAKAIVIADDLTGSNATGVLLKKNGLNTYTVLHAEDASNPALRGCDCLVVSTGSRAIDGKAAYDAVHRTLSPLVGDGVRLYAKRIDSTLRGNLGAETDAFLDVLGDEYIAVCVPCFPSSGRVLVGGYLLVNGVPLQNTEVAKDPKCPITTSSAKALFQTQSRNAVASLHLDDVAKGPEELCRLFRRLVAEGNRIIVCDSVTLEDMETIAEALLLAKQRYVPVDPGVFTAISAKRLISPVQQAAGGKVLCVIGSVNGVARQQVKQLLASLPVHSLYLNVEEVLESAPRRAAEIQRVVMLAQENAAEADTVAVIGSGIDPEKRVPFEPYMQRDGLSMEQLSAVISGAFAETACRILGNREVFRALYSTGGDITAAINGRMGTMGFRLMDEVVPLGVYGELVGGGYDGLKFISKGGMVGDENAMVTCVKYLKEKL